MLYASRTSNHMRSDYLDTVLFAAAAVLAIAIGWVMLKMRQVERDMERMDEDSLKDEDMRLDDDPISEHNGTTTTPINHHPKP